MTRKKLQKQLEKMNKKTIIKFLMKIIDTADKNIYAVQDLTFYAENCLSKQRPYDNNTSTRTNRQNSNN